jgi:hypothetical protein
VLAELGVAGLRDRPPLSGSAAVLGLDRVGEFSGVARCAAAHVPRDFLDLFLNCPVRHLVDDARPVGAHDRQRVSWQARPAVNATKHILFVMGIIGLIGAFIPFVEVKRSGIALELTAKELSFGLEKTHKLINYQLPAIAEAKLPPDVKSARDDVRLVAQALKFSIATSVLLIVEPKRF